jgi:DNA-binding NarL/FixJ family response regulator
MKLRKENKMENQPVNKNEEVPALKILKQINDGELDPKSLTTPQRRQCVEVLKIEGHSYASIAKLLNWSEKTIQRDWDEICKKNAQKTISGACPQVDITVDHEGERERRLFNQIG